MGDLEATIIKSSSIIKEFNDLVSNLKGPLNKGIEDKIKKGEEIKKSMESNIRILEKITGVDEEQPKKADSASQEKSTETDTQEQKIDETFDLSNIHVEEGDCLYTSLFSGFSRSASFKTVLGMNCAGFFTRINFEDIDKILMKAFGRKYGLKEISRELFGKKGIYDGVKEQQGNHMITYDSLMGALEFVKENKKEVTIKVLKGFENASNLMGLSTNRYTRLYLIPSSRDGIKDEDCEKIAKVIRCLYYDIEENFINENFEEVGCEKLENISIVESGFREVLRPSTSDPGWKIEKRNIIDLEGNESSKSKLEKRFSEKK